MELCLFRNKNMLNNKAKYILFFLAKSAFLAKNRQDVFLYLDHCNTRSCLTQFVGSTVPICGLSPVYE